MKIIKMYLGSFLIFLIISIAMGLSILPYIVVIKYINNVTLMITTIILIAPLLMLVEVKFYPWFEKIFDKIDKWIK